MKNLATPIIICFAIILFACAGQNKHSNNNDLKKSNLNGEVKSIKEISYTITEKYGDVQKEFMISNNVKTYNNRGNIIESCDYEMDGKPTFKYTYKYNENDKMVEYIFFLMDGTLGFKCNCKYDSEGNMIEFDVFNTDGSLRTKTSQKFDEQGNCIQELEFKTNDSLTTKKDYKYDEQSNLIVMIETRISDGMVDNTKYKYDKNSYCIEENKYNSDGKLVSKRTCIYDIKGNITERNDDYAVNPSFFRSKSNYTYSNYDDKGNWLKKIDIYNGKSKYITEREIEYF